MSLQLSPALPFLLACHLIFLPSTANAGGAVYIKGGSVFLSDTGQNLDGNLQKFDASSDGAYAVSFEIRKKNGLSFGAEYFSFRNSFTTASNSTGKASASIATFVFRKYFNDSGGFQPFVGIGVGGGERDYSYRLGTIPFDSSASGLALQINAGVEVKIDSNVALLFELKGTNFEKDGWGANDYNPSGVGLFLGVGMLC